MATSTKTAGSSHLHWLLVVFVGLVAVLTLSRALGGTEGPPQPPREPQPVVISSPWAGVFRAAEANHVEPFVELGSDVDHNSVVGVIENLERIRVKAGVRGKIIDTLVAEGDEVQPGQVLFVVEPPRPNPTF